jgi:uncharacterized protein (TIGR03435 family)
LHSIQLTAVFCIAIGAASAIAQSPDTFEVASIKPSDPLKPSISFRLEPGGGIKTEGTSLKSLVQYAYDLRDFQLSGAAGWIASERYVVLAKGTIADGPADFRQMNDEQQKAFVALVRKRLQNLLAERFQLAVHTQTKQLPIYALVVAKNGPKLQPNHSPDGSVRSMTTGRSLFKATRANMEGIAEALAGLTGRPVRDETGLRGFFDFKMEWMPDAPAAAPDAVEKRPAETVGPTIFTALQEQLGLKLESKKGPVEILVIDRAEHPSEN